MAGVTGASLVPMLWDAAPWGEEAQADHWVVGHDTEVGAGPRGPHGHPGQASRGGAHTLVRKSRLVCFHHQVLGRFVVCQEITSVPGRNVMSDLWMGDKLFSLSSPQPILPRSWLTGRVGRRKEGETWPSCYFHHPVYCWVFFCRTHGLTRVSDALK